MGKGQKAPRGGRRDFFQEYEMLVLLGSGSFGEVWVCREKASGHTFACKLMEKGDLSSRGGAGGESTRRLDLMREIAVMKLFQGQHAGIVQLREVLEGDLTVQVVMELCKGGDLFDLLCKNDRLPEPAARLVFAQLASALAACHAKGVLHRDLKPENILFDGPVHRLYAYKQPDDPVPAVTAKLADFGLSLILAPGGSATGFCGSRFYTAPEMVRGRSYAFPADVWSLGVVLCVMLTARLPFAGESGDDLEGLKSAILRGRVGFQQPEWEGVSEDAVDLVRAMLQVPPDRRIRAADILCHPWVAGAAPLHPPAWETPPLPLPTSEARAVDAPSGSSQDSPHSPGTPTSTCEMGAAFALAQQGQAGEEGRAVALHLQRSHPLGEGSARDGEQRAEGRLEGPSQTSSSELGLSQQGSSREGSAEAPAWGQEPRSMWRQGQERFSAEERAGESARDQAEVEGRVGAGGARTEALGIEEFGSEGSSAGKRGQRGAHQEAQEERPVPGGSVRRGRVRRPAQGGPSTPLPTAPAPHASAPEPSPSLSLHERPPVLLSATLGGEPERGTGQEGDTGGSEQGGGRKEEGSQLAADECSSEEDCLDGDVGGAGENFLVFSVNSSGSLVAADDKSAEQGGEEDSEQEEEEEEEEEGKEEEEEESAAFGWYNPESTVPRSVPALSGRRSLYSPPAPPPASAHRSAASTPEADPETAFRSFTGPLSKADAWFGDAGCVEEEEEEEEEDEEEEEQGEKEGEEEGLGAEPERSAGGGVEGAQGYPWHADGTRQLPSGEGGQGSSQAAASDRSASSNASSWGARESARLQEGRQGQGQEAEDEDSLIALTRLDSPASGSSGPSVGRAAQVGSPEASFANARVGALAPAPSRPLQRATSGERAAPGGRGRKPRGPPPSAAAQHTADGRLEVSGGSRERPTTAGGQRQAQARGPLRAGPLTPPRLGAGTPQARSKAVAGGSKKGPAGGSKNGPAGVSKKGQRPQGLQKPEPRALGGTAAVAEAERRGGPPARGAKGSGKRPSSKAPDQGRLSSSLREPGVHQSRVISLREAGRAGPRGLLQARPGAGAGWWWQREAKQATGMKGVYLLDENGEVASLAIFTKDDDRADFPPLDVGEKLPSAPPSPGPASPRAPEPPSETPSPSARGSARGVLHKEQEGRRRGGAAEGARAGAREGEPGARAGDKGSAPPSALLTPPRSLAKTLSLGKQERGAKLRGSSPAANPGGATPGSSRGGYTPGSVKGASPRALARRDSAGPERTSSGVARSPRAESRGASSWEGGDASGQGSREGRGVGAAEAQEGSRDLPALEALREEGHSPVLPGNSISHSNSTSPVDGPVTPQLSERQRIQLSLAALSPSSGAVGEQLTAESNPASTTAASSAPAGTDLEPDAALAGAQPEPTGTLGLQGRGKDPGEKWATTVEAAGPQERVVEGSGEDVGSADDASLPGEEGVRLSDRRPVQRQLSPLLLAVGRRPAATADAGGRGVEPAPPAQAHAAAGEGGTREKRGPLAVRSGAPAAPGAGDKPGASAAGSDAQDSSAVPSPLLRPKSQRPVSRHWSADLSARHMTPAMKRAAARRGGAMGPADHGSGTPGRQGVSALSPRLTPAATEGSPRHDLKRARQGTALEVSLAELSPAEPSTPGCTPGASPHTRPGARSRRTASVGSSLDLEDAPHSPAGERIPGSPRVRPRAPMAPADTGPGPVKHPWSSEQEPRLSNGGGYPGESIQPLQSPTLGESIQPLQSPTQAPRGVPGSGPKGSRPRAAAQRTGDRAAGGAGLQERPLERAGSGARGQASTGGGARRDLQGGRLVQAVKGVVHHMGSSYFSADPVANPSRRPLVQQQSLKALPQDAGSGDPRAPASPSVGDSAAGPKGRMSPFALGFAAQAAEGETGSESPLKAGPWRRSSTVGGKSPLAALARTSSHAPRRAATSTPRSNPPPLSSSQSIAGCVAVQEVQH